MSNTYPTKKNQQKKTKKTKNKKPNKQTNNNRGEARCSRRIFKQFLFLVRHPSCHSYSKIR